MSLTPEEIVDADLKLALRGYATDQVDELLDRLADQVERNEQELADLRAKLEDAEARVAAAAETEATLQRTLVVAQTTADRMIADAEAATAELRDRAERDAEGRLDAARQEADRIEAEAVERRRISEEQLAADERAVREQHEQEHRDLQASFAAERDRLEGILDAIQARATEQVRILRAYLDDQHTALGSLEAQLAPTIDETSAWEVTTPQDDGADAEAGPEHGPDRSAGPVTDGQFEDPVGDQADDPASGDPADDTRPHGSGDTGELREGAEEAWPSEAEPVGLRVRVREDVEASEEAERRRHHDGPAASTG